MELKQVFEKFGQSFWLDFIRRRMLLDGELQRLIAEDGLRGVTSNPSIFQKAIGESTDYDDALAQLIQEPNLTASQLYEHVAIEDIQSAADLFAPMYAASEGRDGFVCLEVSPYLAHDTEATLTEARRLWREVARENLMVKVPGTQEGLPAVRELISEGINVNVTLLFSRKACEQVFEAYVEGLEILARKQPAKLSRVASVASMFVSRVDSAVTPLLEAPEFDAKVRAERAKLVGKVALANAKLAYQDWKRACASERFQRLVEQGARPQRLLWASTGTKDRRLSDVLYVEELIGPQTVNTLPPHTLDAFREHGVAQARLEQDVEAAQQVLDDLARFGISLDAVTDELVVQGVAQFSQAFDALLGAIEEKRERVARRPTIPARPTTSAREQANAKPRQTAQRRG